MPRKARLRIRLAVIFAAIHFFAVGSAVLGTAGGRGGGEGLAFVFLGWDLPLLALCQHLAVCSEPLYNDYSLGISRFSVYFLLAGTLMYALCGFIIGAAIDGVRALVAQRRGQH